MALTYDQITAITRKFWMPKFPQLVFDQNLLQKRLAAKGTKPESGERIIQPLIYQASMGGAYSDYDTFDIAGEDQVTAAVFNWKYYEVPITMARSEILKNQGKEGVRKLMDTKMKAAAMKMSDLLATDMFAISTSAGSDSTEKLNSLENMLNDSGGSLTAGDVALTYGGITISSTVNTWWDPVTRDGGGDGCGLYYQSLNTFWYLVADGNIQTTLVIGHNNSLASYLNGQQSQQRYVKQNDLDAGFLTAEINGRTFAADLHVSDNDTTKTENRLYFLNEDFIDFVTHRDENNRLEPFAKPVDQAVIVAHIMWAGELTCNDRRRQGLIENFDSLDSTAMTIT